MMNSRIAVIVFALLLSACASTTKQMEQGKISLKQKNYTEAFQELKPAAERGNKDAQYAVGYMYFYGKGVEKDKKSGRKWINKAAKQGQPQAIRAMERLKTKPKPAVTTSALPDQAAPITPN